MNFCGFYAICTRSDKGNRKGSNWRADGFRVVLSRFHRDHFPGNDPVDVSDGRLAALRKQIEAQLRPVLRERDFGEFDLERAFKIVAEMAEAVS